MEETPPESYGQYQPKWYGTQRFLGIFPLPEKFVVETEEDRDAMTRMSWWSRMLPLVFLSWRKK